MWVLLSLALLLTLRSPLAQGASNFHLRNHTGLLFLYDFTEGQRSEAVPTNARDITGRYLMGNLTTSPTAVSWSASQQGMRIPSPAGGVRAESLETSAALLSHLSTDFSLEFFLNSPPNDVGTNFLIAGFGDWPAGAPFSPCDPTNTVSEGGWRLYSSFGITLTFDGVFFFDDVAICRSLSLTIAANTLRHFVIRVQTGVVSVVSHEASTSFPYDEIRFSPTLWNRNPAPLTIANPHPTSGWTGTMHMIAMYDRFLSNAEIAANRDFGPPNSLPTPTPTLSIPEDSTTTLYP